MQGDGIAPASAVPLAPWTTLGVGGPARWYIRAVTPDMIPAAVEWAASRAVPLFVLGGGSNVVIADTGWSGLVLHIDLRGLSFADAIDGTSVTAGAGEPWDPIVAAAVGRRLAGIECLSGIPGSAGGTPVQNVGAYGQEVGSVIAMVEAFDRVEARCRTLHPLECGFGYRTSRFKQEPDRFVLLSVTLRLSPGAPRIVYPDLVAYFAQRGIATPGLAETRSAVLAIRRRKGMVLDSADQSTRSVGSFFVNPVMPAEQYDALVARIGPVPAHAMGGGQVKVPAAWLIERAGARSFVIGGAAVSNRHPLALVNRGGATARDIVALAVQIKRTVADRFGIWLTPEPVFIGFNGNADVDFLKDARG